MSSGNADVDSNNKENSNPLNDMLFKMMSGLMTGAGATPPPTTTIPPPPSSLSSFLQQYPPLFGQLPSGMPIDEAIYLTSFGKTCRETTREERYRKRRNKQPNLQMTKRMLYLQLNFLCSIDMGK